MVSASRKAQASFVMLLAVLLLVAIVVYYAFQGIEPPPVPGDEDRAVSDMIEGIITSGAELALKAMEYQGGYLTPPEESVALQYIGVPYWQMCQNDMSPAADEIEVRFKKAIEYYMNNHTRDIEMFFGKNLSISNVSRVDVRLLDNRIDLDVYMTTLFEGRRISQPYSVSVPTIFKQLFDFAKDTIAEINKPPSQGGRMLETFTITSIYNSEYLPTIGALTRCGESIHLSSQEISERLQTIAAYVRINTKWWETTSDYGYYAIGSVNSNTYQNLEPRILFPDGFSVESSGNVHITNNDYISDLPLVPYCITVYGIKYSFGYPVIINLKDPETGYDFNFAVYVNVDDMLPGDCDASATEPTPFKDECSDLPCNARIRVVDCNNNPLQGANAYFGGCLIGSSDADGWIESPILCGTRKLEIYYNAGYQYYSETVSSSGLVEVTYRLCKVNDLVVHFDEMEILGDSSGSTCHPCASPTDCPGPAESYTCMPRNTGNCTFITFTSKDTGKSYSVNDADNQNLPPGCDDYDYAESHVDECISCDLASKTVNYVPAGNYDVTVDLLDTENGRYVGHVEGEIEILESTTDVYVTVPNFGKPTMYPSVTQDTCILNALIECNQPVARQT